MTVDVLVKRLDSVLVATTRMHLIDELMSHTQVLACGDMVDLEDPAFDTLPTYTPIPGPSGRPGRIDRLAPRLGEHNDVMCSGLFGFDDRIRALAEAGAVLSGL